MEKLSKSKYSFSVIAPFNSRMVLDYSTLIGKYEKIRKILYLKLEKIYPNQVLIEQFADEGNPFESAKNWAREDENMIQGEIEELLFKGTGGSGAIQRDSSIITIQINKKFTLPLDIIGIDIFSAAPILIFETMSFHEYGIGMIYCKLAINFKQDFIEIEEKKPREIMADLLDKIVRLPDVLKESESIGKNSL